MEKQRPKRPSDGRRRQKPLLARYCPSSLRRLIIGSLFSSSLQPLIRSGSSAIDLPIMTYDRLYAKLISIGQQQVLRFYDELDPAGRERLLSQLETLDLDYIAELAEQQVRQKAILPLPQDIKPIIPLPPVPQTTQHKALYAQAAARGKQLLAAGKVGAFLVAGGQGTRLGYDGPKGEYPVTPIKGKPLFQVFAEHLTARTRDAGHVVPWYIMTSQANDAATRAFFAKHNYFGYDASAVFFFQQGMMPAFAMDGKLLLGEKSSLALSPDGHGGGLRAIQRSGALADMQRRGVGHLSYFQVDNPLVCCIDPLFIGLHDLAGSEMSSKTIAKAGPMEKVGNFCFGDGRLQVIEYTDLPEDLALATNADGSLKFNAGSIAIHALRVSFIERLTAGGQLRLPWHRAQKKVPFVDASGQLSKPERPNAIKLEQFVFDAIPLAANPLVYTTDRAEEFSPVKNPDGIDSIVSSKRDQIRRHARWLSQAGVQVPMKQGEPDCVLEISPLFALSAEELAARKLPKEVGSRQGLYLG
jgi:UDP-N-acetylglucosamine/UDP-N-acetylgalactosamine diphosphorylase